MPAPTHQVAAGLQEEMLLLLLGGDGLGVSRGRAGPPRGYQGRYCIHRRLRGRSCFVMAADAVFRGKGAEGGERRGSRVLVGVGGYGTDERNGQTAG